MVPIYLLVLFIIYGVCVDAQEGDKYGYNWEKPRTGRHKVVNFARWMETAVGKVFDMGVHVVTDDYEVGAGYPDAKQPAKHNLINCMIAQNELESSEK